MERVGYLYEGYVQSDPANIVDVDVEAIDTHRAKLTADITRAQIMRVSALEAELVSVDSALAQLQGARGDERTQAQLSARFFAQFGPLPLEPVEPDTLCLLPLTGNMLDMAVCAPCSATAADVAVRGAPTGPLSTGSPLTFDVVFTGDRFGTVSADERRAAAAALAPRLRIAASLVPARPALPAPPGQPPGPPQPILLPHTCELNGAGDGVRVSVLLPPFLPRGGAAAAAAGPCPPAWDVRVGLLAVGGSAIRLGDLDKGFSLVQAQPGPPRSAGALHAACKAGSVEALRRVLSAAGEAPELRRRTELQRRRAAAYSTEEADEVRS